MTAFSWFVWFTRSIASSAPLTCFTMLSPFAEINSEILPSSSPLKFEMLENKLDCLKFYVYLMFSWDMEVDLAV